MGAKFNVNFDLFFNDFLIDFWIDFGPILDGFSDENRVIFLIEFWTCYLGSERDAARVRRGFGAGSARVQRACFHRGPPPGRRLI